MPKLQLFPFNGPVFHSQFGLKPDLTLEDLFQESWQNLREKRGNLLLTHLLEEIKFEILKIPLRRREVELNGEKEKKSAKEQVKVAEPFLNDVWKTVFFLLLLRNVYSYLCQEDSFEVSIKTVQGQELRFFYRQAFMFCFD